MNARGSYGFAVGIALLGLGPNVILSASLLPLEPQMAVAFGAAKTDVGLAVALGFAGYAVGAVFGAQAALRWKGRRIFLVSEVLFALASLGAALATSLPVFAVAHVLQGLSAGAMLITALPPLVTSFGAGRVPLSAAIVDLGLFGATALGPIVGSLVLASGTHGWRWLFGGAAVLAAVGWLIAFAGYDAADPPDPERRPDRPALMLVALGAPLLFVAASLVATHELLSAAVLIPAVVGIALLGSLFVVEDRRRDALIPIRALSTMLPVIGLIAAMLGGAAVVTSTDLLQTALGQLIGQAPRAVAAAFWPMPVGAVLGAAMLWWLFRTRWVPVLVEAGLLTLAAGAALLLVGWTGWAAGLAVLLLGFGAAATVSPGLFLTGLGLRSTQLGRAFALVQLLRSVATYAVAPVALQLGLRAASPEHGLRTGLVVVAIGCAVGVVLILALLIVSGGRLRAPDLEAWLEGDKGLPSPATAAHLRPGVHDEDAAPLRPGRH